ncbi:MAG: hypothetical protein VXW38_18470, partial [Bacteroidota bacterium]|nr:hypothetical protein [Bacteroidota bacterium]
KDKKATIFLNGEETYSELFKEDLGNIMGLGYIFEGTGSIQSVQLKNAQGEIAFEDDFSAKQ